MGKRDGVILPPRSCVRTDQAHLPPHIDLDPGADRLLGARPPSAVDCTFEVPVLRYPTPLLFVSLFAISACPVADQLCDPGETQLCICAGGAHGGQACTSDGQAWGVCDCDAGDDDTGDDDSTADDDSTGDDDASPGDDDSTGDDDTSGDDDSTGDDDATGPDYHLQQDLHGYPSTYGCPDCQFAFDVMYQTVSEQGSCSVACNVAFSDGVYPLGYRPSNHTIALYIYYPPYNGWYTWYYAMASGPHIDFYWSGNGYSRYGYWDIQGPNMTGVAHNTEP